MAITYPGTIDVLTNPAGTQTLSSLDHALQHSNVNDGIEAIEAVLGTTGGTSVLKNFSAGQFAAKNNNDTFGSPTVTGGTINNAVFGTPTFTVGSDATGDVFYRGSGTVLARLGPGTSGQFLKTQGAGAAPVWSTVTAGDSRISRNLEPAAGALPDSNFPALGKTVGSNWTFDTLDFDPATNESVYWYEPIPTDLTPNTGTLTLYWTATVGTAGQAVYWQVTSRPIADGEVIDATTTPSTVTDNANDTLLGTTSIHKLSIPLSTSAWASGEVMQIKVNRDAANVSDALTGDAKLLRATLEVRA